MLKSSRPGALLAPNENTACRISSSVNDTSRSKRNGLDYLCVWFGIKESQAQKKYKAYG